jgi:hypothetical protein
MDDPEDISSLFFGDEAAGPARAQALAAALRGKQQLGQLGVLTGDKVLGSVGQQMLRGAQEQQDLIPKAANMRLQRAMEAEKARTEADWRRSQEAHMQQQESIARQQLAQGKYVQGQWGVLNTKTGAVDPYQKPPKEASPQELEKEWKDLTDSLSTTRGRGNLNKEQQQRLYAGDRIRAIAANPDGSPKDLPPSQMAELAAMSAQLAQGSSPTQHAIESMTPSSVGSDASKLQQWLLNEPRGAGQQKFVQLLLDQARREEEVIKPQIRAAQFQAIPNYVHLRGKDKARFEAIAKASGIDPSSIDDAGLERAAQQAASAPHPQADAALKWARENPDDARSARILARLGGAR